MSEEAFYMDTAWQGQPEGDAMDMAPYPGADVVTAGRSTPALSMPSPVADSLTNSNLSAWSAHDSDLHWSSRPLQRMAEPWQQGQQQGQQQQQQLFVPTAAPWCASAHLGTQLAQQHSPAAAADLPAPPCSHPAATVAPQRLQRADSLSDCTVLQQPGCASHSPDPAASLAGMPAGISISERAAAAAADPLASLTEGIAEGSMEQQLREALRQQVALQQMLQRSLHEQQRLQALLEQYGKEVEGLVNGAEHTAGNSQQQQQQQQSTQPACCGRPPRHPGAGNEASQPPAPSETACWTASSSLTVPSCSTSRRNCSAAAPASPCRSELEPALLSSPLLMGCSALEAAELLGMMGSLEDLLLP